MKTSDFFMGILYGFMTLILFLLGIIFIAVTIDRTGHFFQFAISLVVTILFFYTSVYFGRKKEFKILVDMFDHTNERMVK